MRRIVGCLAIMVCALALTERSPAGEGSVQLEAGPGRDLTISRCAVCHSLDYIPMNAPVMTRAAWDKSVHKMIDSFGAPITDDETRQILEYLGAHYSAPDR